YEYTRDHSAYKVTKRDVSNLLTRIRQEFRGGADEDLAAAEFSVGFRDANKDNIVSVNDTSSGETGANSLTTVHMRTLFVQYTGASIGRLYPQNEQVSSLCVEATE
ncbi:hypothetical protein JG688_00001912, partial [Phytophthora aleatoria]